MLTEPQMKHFRTFGFVHLRQLLNSAEMGNLTERAERLMEAEPDARSTRPGHLAVSPFLEKDPELALMPEDDRFYAPAEQLLGSGLTWGGSEGNRGSFNETNSHSWHCDRIGQINLQYPRLKMMIYLQPMRKEAGALRVIPGSHRLPFHEELSCLNSGSDRPAIDNFGVDGPEVPCHALEVAVGDVVMFDHYLFHGVYGKQEGRSYIALKYAAGPQSEEQYRALGAHGQDAASLHPVYRSSQRPRIRDMVEPLLEWEDRLHTA